MNASVQYYCLPEDFGHRSASLVQNLLGRLEICIRIIHIEYINTQHCFKVCKVLLVLTIIAYRFTVQATVLIPFSEWYLHVVLPPVLVSYLCGSRQLLGPGNESESEF